MKVVWHEANRTYHSRVKTVSCYHPAVPGFIHAKNANGQRLLRAANVLLIRVPRTLVQDICGSTLGGGSHFRSEVSSSFLDALANHIYNE